MFQKLYMRCAVSASAISFVVLVIHAHLALGAGYKDQQLVRCSSPDGQSGVASEVLAAMRDHPPHHVNAWDDLPAEQLENHNTLMPGSEFIVSKEQREALEAVEGLKVAVLVPDMDAFLSEMQRRNLIGLEKEDQSERRARDADVVGGAQIVSARNDQRQLQDGLTSDEWYGSHRRYEEIVARIGQLEEQYPGLLTVQTIVNASFWNRDIPVMRITNKGRPADLDPPSQVLVTGTLHAREWAPAIGTLYAAEKMLSAFSVSPKVAQVLSTVELIVIPVANPDGYAYTWGPEHNDWVCDSTHEQAGECDRLWRKSRSMESYFPPDSSCIGVDLNRNFPVDFGERGAGGSVSHMCEANSPGFRAFSEPETKMIRDVVAELPRLRGVIDFHAFGQMILTPWLWNKEPPPHAAILDRAGRLIQTAINQADNRFYSFEGNGNMNIYTASGSMIDWIFTLTSNNSQPILPYVIELRSKRWNPGFLLPADEIIEVGEEVFSATLALAEVIGSNQIDTWQQLDSAATSEDYCDHPWHWKLYVDFHPDNYPAETTWVLEDRDSGTAIPSSPLTHTPPVP